MILQCLHTHIYIDYKKHTISDGGPSFKVLFYFSGILVIKASSLAIELHITLIDVINISVVLELPPPAVF